MPRKNDKREGDQQHGDGGAGPSFTFDARSGELHSTSEAFAGTSSLDKTLRFSSPRLCDEAQDGKAWLSRAFLVPSPGVKTAFRFALRNAAIAKISHNRRDATMAIFAVGSADADYVDPLMPLLRFMLAMDAHIVEAVKANTTAWFMHKMNEDLIEEYHRGCASLLPGGSYGARLVFDGRVSDASFQVGSRVNVVVQMVGLRFHPQYFTCIWKLVSAEQAGEEEEEAVVRHRNRRNPFVAYALEGAAGASDEEEAEELGPDPEQREEIREHWRAYLTELEREAQSRIDTARDLVGILQLKSVTDDLRKDLMDRSLRHEEESQHRIDVIRDLVRVLNDAPASSDRFPSVVQDVEDRLAELLGGDE